MSKRSEGQGEAARPRRPPALLRFTLLGLCTWCLAGLLVWLTLRFFG